MPEMTPGARHRERREAAHLTRTQLVAKSGVSLRTIVRFELENRLPRVDKLMALAAALDTTLGDLLGERDAA